MIITLIFLGLFAIPILLSILGNVVHEIYCKMDEDILTLLSAIGGIFFAGCIVVIICMHVGVNKNIEINRIEYESLCHRLEIVNSDYEDMSKSDVIKDISEWNKAVLYKKYWAKSPWTSWFYSQKVVDELKYIDYK